MKKGKTLIVAILFLQLILITSSINAINIPFDSKQIERSESKTIAVYQQFSIPEIKDNEGFINIYSRETNSYIATSGEPVLPTYVQTLEFPRGTQIDDIECIFSDIHEIQLSKKVIPASRPVPWHEADAIHPKINEDIYCKNQLYPENWYSYTFSGGLNKNNEDTTFLTVQMNPVRYNPVEDTIQFVDTINLEITYEEPERLPVSADEYDLVIICYDRYARLLDPLLDHKNSHHIRTIIVPLKDIYKGTHFPVEGRDDPEKIKYFIKNAKDNWGIKYAMLVGSFMKVPIRYTHLETDTGGVYEELEFASDLYYSDIYDSEWNFSSWDSDGDKVYGEWPYPEGHPMEDIVDLSPDVHVGRLACMNRYEVKTMVKKIIDYEQNAYDSDWFNTMIVVGGDTFDKSWEGGTDYNEGEVANEKAIEFMPEFNPVKIWTTLENLNTANIHNEICKGAGFLYFVGHGNPRKWGTHVNGDYINWTEDFRNKDMYKLTNNGMYPILMVGGCHNSEIDVTPLNIIKGLIEERLHYFSSDLNDLGSYWTSNWVPECWSWVFVAKNRGGAIASIGSVGYGGVDIGDSNGNEIPDCIEGLDGWFETEFFRLYNEEKIDILGETYSQTITNYVNTFPVVYSDRYNCKIVETHILLGDPSLKIGGYQ